MIRRFREALRPTAADPAIAQQQSLLYIVLLGLAGPGLLFGIAMAILWLLGRTPAAGVIAGLGVQPFYALSYWLGRRGRTRLAALIPVLIVFLVMAASFFQVGVGHVSTVGMAMVVATAGILLGSRIALALSALGVLAYAFAGWAQNTGFISGAILPQEAVIADAIGLGLSRSNAKSANSCRHSSASSRTWSHAALADLNAVPCSFKRRRISPSWRRRSPIRSISSGRPSS